MSSRVARVPTNVTLPYNGSTLDRGSAHRADDEWLAAAGAGARVLAFWRDRCLVAGGVPVSATVPEREQVFLGMADVGVFACDLSDLDEPAAVRAAGADSAVDIRVLFPSLEPEEAATLAYARGMLHWTRNQRFCGACGSATVARSAGHVRKCGGCGKLWFPRIEPAVIMLVESPDRRSCLLGRHRGATGYSTLAGFVEIGESLEEAVARELAEEAGVRVSSVSYQASQAWPFPSGMMIGFRAVASSSVVSVDEDELVEARWFTRDEVRALTDRRPDSIESFLVAAWLAEE
jgi:NAD+ diphosphatase